MKTLNETTVCRLPARYLLAALNRAGIERCKLICEMIAAGRGYEKPSETLLKGDDLALRVNANAWALGKLNSEKSARMVYHGSLKPIRQL
jgi:hypothetical protein